MTQFARVVSGLLEGQFICAVTDQEGYQFLNSALMTDGRTNRDEVDQFLRRLNLRLTVTREGGAFFAAHVDIDDEGKKAAKKRFTDLKNILRPLISFLELVMRVTRDDDAISAGRKLDLNRMMARISENISLTNELRRAAADTGINVKDGSDRERLNKIIRRFKDEGILRLVNAESEIYMFTGRIEWLMEAIEFLMMHDQISEEDKEFDQRVGA